MNAKKLNAVDQCEACPDGLLLRIAGVLLACAVACAMCGAAAAEEPFTMVWHQSKVAGADRLSDELPVFGSGIPIYKVEGFQKVSIKPLTRGEGYRRRESPYAVRAYFPMRREKYGFADLFAEPDKTVDSPYARSGRPFFVYERISRPPFFLPRDGAPLADREDYAAWKEAHPGFLGFSSLWELDSDSEGLDRGYMKIPDESVRRELHAAFPRHSPSGMAHRVEWARTAFRLAADFHFGETNVWPLCSYNVGYEHIFGACGVGGLWYEATGQHVGAWNVGAAFVRGAARQRGLDFGWYMAHYRVGRDRNGKVKKGDVGVSLSLHRRQILFGWLSGARYMQTEGWWSLYLKAKDGEALPEATEYARALNDVYSLASRTERGEPYTPLAVLTPLAEPSAANYVKLNRNLLDPVSQTDVFDTLAPIRGDNGREYVNWGLGEQGCLYNSEFGAIFDSLCPDSGQDSAAFARALSRYGHALVVSDRFDKQKFDSPALEAFKKAGGKVHRYPSPECPDRESLRRLLLRIQDEAMPVKVAGNVLWGVNKTSKGWLVWLINNRGVKSYFREPEEFDASCTAHVTITAKATGRVVAADVAPGGCKLVEIAAAPAVELRN